VAGDHSLLYQTALTRIAPFLRVSIIRVTPPKVKNRKCLDLKITIGGAKRIDQRRHTTMKTKKHLLRLMLGGILLVALSGIGQARCALDILPRPASKFIHYFEAAGESRQLSMVERAWLALLMTGQDRRESQSVRPVSVSQL
jgi:hypothetical protein